MRYCRSRDNLTFSPTFVVERIGPLLSLHFVLFSLPPKPYLKSSISLIKSTQFGVLVGFCFSNSTRFDSESVVNVKAFNKHPKKAAFLLRQVAYLLFLSPFCTPEFFTLPGGGGGGTGMFDDPGGGGGGGAGIFDLVGGGGGGTGIL